VVSSSSIRFTMIRSCNGRMPMVPVLLWCQWLAAVFVLGPCRSGRGGWAVATAHPIPNVAVI
jgi:hypothetical protein